MRRIHKFLSLFLLINLVLIFVPRVQGTTGIIANKIAVGTDYPEYTNNGGGGIGFHVPTVYFPYMGRHFLILVLQDEIRTYDLVNGGEVRYEYPEQIPVIATNHGDIKSINYTISGTQLEMYVWTIRTGYDTGISIYKVLFDIQSHARSATLAKFVLLTGKMAEVWLDDETGFSTMWQNRYLIMNQPGNYEEYLYRVDLITGAVINISKTPAYFWRPSEKIATRSDGIDYMVLGRHLAGSEHWLLNLNTFDWLVEMNDDQGGSPNSQINPYRSGSTWLIPMTASTVVSTNNTIKWYDSRTLTQVGETGFPLNDANGQFRDDLIAYPNQWFNWPYGMAIIAKTTDNKYFAIGNVNQAFAWFLLDGTTLNLVEYGILSDVASDWYRAINIYADQNDATNWPIVNMQEEKVYFMTKVGWGTNWLDLWEIDFSVLNIDPSTWNELNPWYWNTEGGATGGPTLPDVSLVNVPTMIASRLGITTFSAGIILSMLFWAFGAGPVGLYGGKFAGMFVFVWSIGILGLAVGLSWLPYWIMLLIVFLVAVGYAVRAGKLFG